jgi:hypothetical protein
LAYLKRKSASKDRVATWARTVESIVRNHILPTFGDDVLAEPSSRPADVMKWHLTITEKGGKVVANHSAKVLRAACRRNVAILSSERVFSLATENCKCTIVVVG